LYIWPNGIQYERVLLFVTTCLAHGLHRVAETIRANVLLPDKLVSSVKKVLVKAPHRKKRPLKQQHREFPFRQNQF
jgi:hypothetical protein